jgi:hypothetical protein
LYQGILLSLPICNTNFIRMKPYKLLDGPHSVAKMSATLDASVALTLWMAHRGPDDWFFILQFYLRASELRQTLRCEVHSENEGTPDPGRRGEENARYLTGHSIKLGSVQLYRTMGVTDNWITRRTNMTSKYAYLLCTEEFIDAAPTPIPEFSNLEAAIAWAAHTRHTSSDTSEVDEDEAEVEDQNLEMSDDLRSRLVFR